MTGLALASLVVWILRLQPVEERLNRLLPLLTADGVSIRLVLSTAHQRKTPA